MFALLATVRAQEGQGEALEAAFEELARQVRANEPGCQFYRLAKSRDEPDVYKFIEVYTDKSDFEQHGQTEYFKSGFPKLAACFAARPTVEFLDVF